MVGEVGPVGGGGGAVHLPTVGAVVGGAGGAGGTVVVTRGFVPRTEKTTSELSLGLGAHSWDKCTEIEIDSDRIIFK